MNKEESRSVQIEINEGIIDRMKKEGISMDLMGSVLLILVSLFENKPELLDFADDSNRERRMHILYRQLVRRELLEADIDGRCHYKLTSRGNELVTFVTTQEQIKAEDLSPIAEIELESCEGWITDYVNIFPEVPKGERAIKMHPYTAINKMNAFIKKFKYAKETILAATKMYIDEQSHNPDGYKYTINSNNFISKNPSTYSNYESALAAWCQRYINDGGVSSNKFDTTIFDMV